MSLFIASLNSGSNGNCYYIGNDTEAVLIDAGITCKETEKRMLALGLSMQKVKAIFISHEHIDHISGVKTLSNKYNLPVYITSGTLQFSKLFLAANLVMPFTAGTAINVGGLIIHAFIKQHDANDPHSFVVEYNNIKIGIFTDIGNVCENVIHYFKQCNAVFLEANYDEEMLATGNYPYHLKRRISGGNGHLSNKQAFDLLVAHRPVQMTHLILSHLSKNNNDPAIVEALFKPYTSMLQVVVASRYKASLVYEINAVRNIVVKPVVKSTVIVQQLSMF